MSFNLIPLTAVTSPTFELPYFTHIYRGRKGDGGDLEFLHCYAGGIGTLFAYTFALEVFPCVAELGG